METRKMPSTGNSHLVVFERTPDGDEHALDPGWWLKQQIRSDWNRIKLDTFIPIYLAQPASKSSRKKPEPPTTEASDAPASATPPKQAKPPKTKPKGKKPAAKTVAGAEQQEPASTELSGEPHADAVAVAVEPGSGAQKLQPAASADGTPESAGPQGTDDAA